MANITNLRQAIRSVRVVGVLSDKKLDEVTEVIDGKSVTKITGTLTIKTSDTNFITFGVNMREKTNAGNENKCYAGIKTVMNEYKSIADVGEEDADCIAVYNGEIDPYTDKNGISRVRYKSSFFTRVKAGDTYNPVAEFEIEIYISNITTEKNTEGEETGRILINGWTPTYNGIEPITLVADGEIAGLVESTYSVGQTAMFFGNVINNKVVTVTKIPVAIGKPREKVETKYKNELLVDGASEAYEEGITPIAPYDTTAIQLAIQERTNRINERQNNTSNNNFRPTNPNAKPSGISHGRGLNF